MQSITLVQMPWGSQLNSQLIRVTIYKIIAKAVSDSSKSHSKLLVRATVAGFHEVKEVHHRLLMLKVDCHFWATKRFLQE